MSVFKIVMLSVVVLNVSMPSVMAPSQVAKNNNFRLRLLRRVLMSR